MFKSLVLSTLTLFGCTHVPCTPHKIVNGAIQGPYTNDSIHAWAARTVVAAYPNNKSGVYDICLSLDVGTGRFYEKYEITKLDEMGTDPDFHDVSNACALILKGAEW